MLSLSSVNSYYPNALASLLFFSFAHDRIRCVAQLELHEVSLGLGAFLRDDLQFGEHVRVQLFAQRQSSHHLRESEFFLLQLRQSSFCLVGHEVLLLLFVDVLHEEGVIEERDSDLRRQRHASASSEAFLVLFDLFETRLVALFGGRVVRLEGFGFLDVFLQLRDLIFL